MTEAGAGRHRLNTCGEISPKAGQDGEDVAKMSLRSRQGVSRTLWGCGGGVAAMSHWCCSHVTVVSSCSGGLSPFRKAAEWVCRCYLVCSPVMRWAGGGSLEVWDEVMEARRRWEFHIGLVRISNNFLLPYTDVYVMSLSKQIYIPRVGKRNQVIQLSIQNGSSKPGERATTYT